MAFTEFCWEVDNYVRELDVKKHYARHIGIYIAKITGCGFEKAHLYVQKKTQEGGEFFGEDPDALIMVKDENGDRVPKVVKFSKVIQTIKNKNWLFSPAMMAYCQPEEEESITAIFCRDGVAKRSSWKQEKFKFDQLSELKEIDEVERLTYIKRTKIADALQSTFKTKNNSVSGAHSSPHNPLFAPTIHPTLTSLCYVSTTLANANNERFLAGNKHYYSYVVTIANLISIVANTDFKKVRDAMELYNLYVPTVEDVLSMVERSSSQYWNNPDQMNLIHRYLARLTRLELSAILYTGDFYHLSKHNPEFVAKFLARLSTVVTENVPMENPQEWVDQCRDDMFTHIGNMCSKYRSKQGFKHDKEHFPENYQVVAHTTKTVIEAVREYQPMIQGFWITKNLPHSISEFRNSLRHVVIASDTDSTIFTVQEWVKKFCGGTVALTHEGICLSNAVTYLTSQVNIHQLAMMSAQLGASRDMVHFYQMKSEFFFPITIVSSIPKHYLSSTYSQEGNVFDIMKLDIKGVQFIKTKVKRSINQLFNETINFIIDEVLAGRLVSVLDLLNRVVNLEHQIKDKLSQRDATYLAMDTIKHISSYTNPQSSKYIYYDMWQSVFAPKYGNADAPPYACYKISLNGHSKTELKEFLANIKDRELSGRLLTWCQANNKMEDFNATYIPVSLVEEKGIPEEFLVGGNFNKIVADMMSHFYLLLESAGIYMKDKHNIRQFDNRYHELADVKEAA